MATNRHYVITVGTAADLSGLEKDLDKALKKPRTIKVNAKDTEVKNTTKSVKDLDNALKDQDSTMQGNLLTFQAANMILSKTIDIMSSMVEQVYKLNGAVTEYKKVTDLTGDSLDKYVNKLSTMGREVARTGDEMVEAATEFRKNSFSDEDSASLALVSTMYQNIADEAISAGDSASFLIAMMKAFNVEAKDATSIIDAVNEVSNSYAVSSADIATALPKVSATLAQAGNSMSESIALLTGATELMPGNASRVARG